LFTLYRRFCFCFFILFFFFPPQTAECLDTRVSFCCYSNKGRILVNAKSIDPF
jgi:hypothetical protein